MKESILDKAADLMEKTIDDIVKEQPISPDYVQFEYSTGNDIGRTWPQAEHVFFTPDINFRLVFSKLPKQDDFNGTVTLKRSAKLTDIISSHESNKNIMMSAKCFEIVKHFNLGDHKYYQFTCIHKDQEYDYVFLILNNLLMDYINYSRSIFYISNLFGNHLRDITFSTKVGMLEHIKLIDKDKYEKEGYREGLVENDVNLKQVFIEPDFQSLDIISWRATNFFSKRLADALGANGITGLQLKETRKVFKQK